MSSGSTCLTVRCVPSCAGTPPLLPWISITEFGHQALVASYKTSSKTGTVIDMA